MHRQTFETTKLKLIRSPHYMIFWPSGALRYNIDVIGKPAFVVWWPFDAEDPYFHSYIVNCFRFEFQGQNVTISNKYALSTCIGIGFAIASHMSGAWMKDYCQACFKRTLSGLWIRISKFYLWKVSILKYRLPNVAFSYRPRCVKPTISIQFPVFKLATLCISKPHAFHWEASTNFSWLKEPTTLLRKCTEGKWVPVSDPFQLDVQV